MAKLTGAIKYTGRIDELSAYRMRGVEGVVLRRKGGPARHKVKKDPGFEGVRRHNEEWKACVKAFKELVKAFYPVKHLCDYNYSGPVQAICRAIQKDDTSHEHGKRHVCFTASGYKLEGFRFNRENSFDSVLSHPLQFTADNERGEAVIKLPPIIPGLNLYNPKKQPLYRFVFSLGVAPDIIFDSSIKEYRHVSAGLPFTVYKTTVWQAWEQSCPAQTLTLQLADWQPVQGVTLVLAAGIEFGRPVTNSEIRFVKYAGAAKILRVV